MAMEKILSDTELKIQEKIERDYKEEYALLQTIPGVKENTSTVIAEIGVDMDIFPNEMHLSSWAGMSPWFNTLTIIRSQIFRSRRKLSMGRRHGGCCQEQEGEKVVVSSLKGG